MWQELYKFEVGYRFSCVTVIRQYCSLGNFLVILVLVALSNFIMKLPLYVIFKHALFMESRNQNSSRNSEKLGYRLWREFQNIRVKTLITVWRRENVRKASNNFWEMLFYEFLTIFFQLRGSSISQNIHIYC